MKKNKDGRIVARFPSLFAGALVSDNFQTYLYFPFSRVVRPQKIKRTNLAISSFKKAKLSNGEKGQIKAKFSKKIYQNISKHF
jgi:hypothetical protein